MADLPKRELKDAFIRSLKTPPKGERYAVADTLVPGLKVSVSYTGAKTYLLWKRWNGAKNPSARTLGKVGDLTLSEARGKAREWLVLRAEGKDPKGHKKRGDTFGELMEEYIALHVSRTRSARKSEREIRADLMARWKDRSIHDITRADAVLLADQIKARGAERQAQVVYGHLRAFFNWLIGRGIYGVESSPCDRLRPTQVIGEKRHRDRVLTDDEIRAVWRAAERMGYPWGPYFQLLLLTGARSGEVGGMRWSEIDLTNAVWTVPAARFKMNVTHTVPLCQDALSILRSLPRFEGSDYVFTQSAGRAPISTYSKAVAKLKALVAAELGTEPTFVTHDMRRTVRTGLAACGVRDEVAELIIGHAKQGLRRVYDQHGYRREMAAGLDRWARRLRTIVSPGEKVVTLHR
jgi:integrase